MLETNIDDMNPEVYSYLMPFLFEEGALDVFLTNIIMKKNRPATKLSVLCHDKDVETLMDIIFEQTTTIGIRKYEVDRISLNREIIKVKTKYGTIRIKKAYKDNKLLKCFPEYEDCKTLAQQQGVSIINIYNEALKEFYSN